MIRFFPPFPLVEIHFSFFPSPFVINSYLSLVIVWAPLELTDRFSSSGELVASASHSRDDLGVILKIVDRRREKDGRGRRGDEREERETCECEERRGVNSRPLRHTRGKTERAQQLVLVYGSQNVRGGKTQEPWVSRGQEANPEIVTELSVGSCRNKFRRLLANLCLYLG